MEIAVPIVLGLVVVLAVIVVGLAAAARQAGQRKAAIENPEVETLTYAVPTGQDPTVLVSALTNAGFEATAEPGPTGHSLSVARPEGVDREDIRAVIARTDTMGPEGPTFEAGRVRFADEERS